jgi:hypothetical protein
MGLHQGGVLSREIGPGGTEPPGSRAQQEPGGLSIRAALYLSDLATLNPMLLKPCAGL